jgi:hypothetical protein
MPLGAVGRYPGQDWEPGAHPGTGALTAEWVDASRAEGGHPMPSRRLDLSVLDKFSAHGYRLRFFRQNLWR